MSAILITFPEVETLLEIFSDFTTFACGLQEIFCGKSFKTLQNVANTCYNSETKMKIN